MPVHQLNASLRQSRYCVDEMGGPYADPELYFSPSVTGMFLTEQ